MERDTAHLAIELTCAHCGEDIQSLGRTHFHSDTGSYWCDDGNQRTLGASPPCSTPDCTHPAIATKTLCLQHEADRLAAKQAADLARNERRERWAHDG